MNFRLSDEDSALHVESGQNLPSGSLMRVRFSPESSCSLVRNTNSTTHIIRHDKDVEGEAKPIFSRYRVSTTFSV